MIAIRFLCKGCLIRRTFRVYKDVHFAKPILVRHRFNYWQELKYFRTANVCSQIRHNVNFKHFSQVSIKPSENDVDNSEHIEKGKKFYEVENEFFFNILKSMDQYKSFICDSDENYFKQPDFNITEKEFSDIVNKTDFSSMTVENIIDDFFKVTLYCEKYLKLPISDDLFKNLSVGLVQVCHKLNDDQLMNCIKALLLWVPCDSVKANNFLQLWKALDQKCVTRLFELDWDQDKIFYVMNLWYRLKLTRLSFFVYKAIRKSSRKVLRFEPNQLIQLMFIINTCRKVHPGVSMYELEYTLEKNMSHLTLEEIAIAALAFFKTESKITSENCLSLLANRLMDGAHAADNITITAILKLLRYSYKPNSANDINLLVSKLVPRMDTMIMAGCVHTVLVLTPMIIFHERAINKLVERFLENPSSARLKELEKIAFILSLFNYIPESSPHVLETIVNEMNEPKRESEWIVHRRCLANLLFYLSVLQVYNIPFIAKVLDNSWVTETYGTTHYKIDRVILGLDYNVELECPGANVPHLSQAERTSISKRNSMYLPDPKKRLNIHDAQFLDVIKAAEKILGNKEFYSVNYILPHHPRADIVYCLDDNNDPLPIPQEMRDAPPFRSILKPTQPGNWRCLVIGGRTLYQMNGQAYTGELACKLRQLRLVGYTPILIPWYHWNSNYNQGFLDYVRQKMFARV